MVDWPARTVLKTLYQKLHHAFGPQQWWPGDTPFEIIVGAILTQNTNWSNVEKAIANLKRQGSLSPRALERMTLSRLAKLIRPAGYFNVKAKRLKNFVTFLYQEYRGDLKRMAADDAGRLREKLLGVNGIGPETADSILLYAFQKPAFVVDAYTKRVLYRHNWAGAEEEYHAVQALFTGSFKRDSRLFNEYHALIVRLGKEFCRPRPQCRHCCLRDFHYSLTAKCCSCHRALPVKRDRKPAEGGYLCPGCAKNQ